MAARSATGIRGGIDRFLFAGVDPEAAAWLRIAFAIATPYLFWSEDLTALPVVPSSISPLYEHFVETRWFSVTFLGLCALLAAGWVSRLVCVVLVGVLTPAAFLSFGHHSRTVMIIALLVFAFVPSDTVRVPRNASVVLTTAGPAWPVRVLQLELSLLYGFNALAKTTPAYLRGDALEAMSVVLPNFKVDMSGGTVDLGLLAVPVGLAAVATVGTEYFLAVGFWFRRVKWVAAVVGIVFHLLLALVIQIYKLNLVSIFLYASFLLPLVREKPTRAQPARMTALE